MARIPWHELHDDRAGRKPEVRQLRDGTIVITYRVVLEGLPDRRAGLTLGCDVDGELWAALCGDVPLD